MKPYGNLVYDIIVFTPSGESKHVATTWRCDYASFLLDEMIRQFGCDVAGKWSGTARWRELP
mgnify:FL=1